jgi:hypothetical protein
VLAAFRTRKAPEPLQLADSIERAIGEAWHRRHAAWSATTPFCDAHVRDAVRTATPELSSLATALRTTDDTDADTLRLCRNLLCDGFSSPLYAGCAEDLRREAGRLRFRLLSVRDHG